MAGCFSVRALTEDDFAVTQCAPRNPNLSQASGEIHSNWRLIGDCTLRGRIEEVIRTEAEMYVADPVCQDGQETTQTVTLKVFAFPNPSKTNLKC